MMLLHSVTFAAYSGKHDCQQLEVVPGVLAWICCTLTHRAIVSLVVY